MKRLVGPTQQITPRLICFGQDIHSTLTLILIRTALPLSGAEIKSALGRTLRYIPEAREREAGAVLMWVAICAAVLELRSTLANPKLAASLEIDWKVVRCSWCVTWCDG